jgi:hypothetical protein
MVSLVCAFNYDYIDLYAVDSAANKRLTDYIRGEGVGLLTLSQSVVAVVSDETLGILI